MDQQTFNQYMEAFYQNKNNQLGYSNRTYPKRMEKVTLSLATAPTNPQKINVPFKSALISRVYSTAVPTTDKAGSIKVLFDYDNTMNVANAVSMFVNDSFSLDTEVAVAYLTWDAQADTSIDIFFFVDIDYRAGTTKTQIVGTVTVQEATPLAVKTVPNLVTRLVGSNNTATYTVRAGYYAKVYWSLIGSTSATGSVSVGGTAIASINLPSALTIYLHGQSEAKAGDIISITTNAGTAVAYAQVVEIPI